MIKLLENLKNVEEYNKLFDEVGWGSYDRKVSKLALENSLYTVSIYDDDKIVGFGRLIGDGVCYFYIHDVMVLPSYQKKGIGTMIIDKLKNKVSEYKKINPYLRLYLGASLGKEEFYKKCGFITREEAGLGSGMILK